MSNPGDDVAHALVRAVSRLFSTPAAGREASVGTSADAARMKCVRHVRMVRSLLDKPSVASQRTAGASNTNPRSSSVVQIARR